MDSDDQCDLDTLAALLDSEPEDDAELMAAATQVETETRNATMISGNATMISGNADISQPAIDNEANNDAVLLAELKMMQEKIRMLEAKLLHKSPIVSEPQLMQNKSMSEPQCEMSSHRSEPRVVHRNSDKSVTTAPTVTKSTANAVTVEKPIPRVRKEIDDENMFFSKKGVRVAHAIPSKSSYDKGHDSDSDWEGLDGEPGNDLSDAGRQMNRLLKSKSVGNSIVNHQQKSDSVQTSAKMTGAAKVGQGNEKASVSYTTSLIGVSQQKQTPATVAAAKKETAKEGDIFKEPQSGIRIIKPLVSSERLRTLMEGRRLIRLSVLHLKARSSDIDGDWVTMAVIVSKSEPKVSAKGSKYSIWRLSDLNDCDKVVSLFLFAKVHNDLWKTSVGSVIGVLNASIMQNTEKYQNNDSNEVSITVDAVQKILLLGLSKDLGTCQGFTKAGKQCNNVVNMIQGGYCTYHVQAEYKKHSNKRAELQVTYSGVVPKKSVNKKLCGGGSVFYGGKDYSLSNSKPKKGISLDNIKQHRARSLDSGDASVTATYVRSVGEALKMAAAQGSKQPSTIPPEKRSVSSSSAVPARKTEPANSLLSNAPSSFEKALQYTASTATSRKTSDADNELFLDLLTVPTAGSRCFMKHLEVKDKLLTEDVPAGDQVTRPAARKPVLSAADMLKLHEDTAKRRQLSISEAPKLGRGLTPGTDSMVDLDDMPPARLTATDKAKLKAIAKIKASGGISKQDPNSVKKDLTSPETQQNIRKRIRSNSGENDMSEAVTPSSSSGPSSVKASKKKSRLLGNVDLNSTEIQRLINAKSSHVALVDEEELKKQEEYFDVKEKTEKLESKMDSIRECNYTALKVGAVCQSEGHQIKTHKAIKRFFRCKDCSWRTQSLDRLPTVACAKCGGSSFERTSMLNSKKGPKLPSEELLLRGAEEKFLG